MPEYEHGIWPVSVRNLNCVTLGASAM